MLVLTRKPGERILLESDDGERMEICLVRIGPNNARLGIDAPRRWNIAREELTRVESGESRVESQNVEHPHDVLRRQMALALSGAPLPAEAACDVG